MSLLFGQMSEFLAFFSRPQIEAPFSQFLINSVSRSFFTEFQLFLTRFRKTTEYNSLFWYLSQLTFALLKIVFMQNFLFEKFNEKKSVGEILADVRVFGVKTCPSFWRTTVISFFLQKSDRDHFQPVKFENRIFNIFH